MSEPGRGSTFALYLPRSKPVEARAEDVQAGSEETIAEPLHPPYRGHEEVGESARSLLTDMGQQVTWVTHGRAALDLLDVRREQVGIVFSDIVMPGIDGLELARQIRRRWPDLPVVLTSGYSDVLASQRSRGFEVLQKPYTAEKVMELLWRSVRASA